MTAVATLDRPSWDQTWLAIASTIALRSRCSRRQVGAVIVTRDNRVAAVSYNGPPRDAKLTGPCANWCPRMITGDTGPGYVNCLSIHAEANALLRADWTAIQGGTIYVSSASCVNCAKLVANSGLSRLVHVVRPEDHYRDPDTVEETLRECGILVARSTIRELT